LRLDQERLLAPLEQKVQEAVREVGRQGGFSLLMIRGQPPILYSREALDVTDLVIAQVEKAGE
jgi:Skp family chaperone for outer membrane proteins